jgi:hypothetical protein
MSKMAAKLLALIVISFTVYAWWMVSSAFYDSVSIDQVAYDGPRDCGIIATSLPQKVNDCCAQRAQQYWTGGDRSQRTQSDDAFAACIASGTEEDLALQARSFFFLRDMTATPYLHTPWRWGSGHDYGKGYQ